MRVKIIFVLALLPVLGACDNLPDSALTSTTRGMFLVSGVDPAVGQPGTLVKVMGSGFDTSLKISSPTGAIIPLSSLSPTEINFVVPEGVKGIVEFKVSQGEGDVQLPFIATGNDDSPLLVGSGKGLCRQQQYLTLTGETLNGEVDCILPDLITAALADKNNLEACKNDGQLSCLTGKDFPSVDKAALSYRVAPGKTVAGVLGEASSARLCPK